ncbi:MAG: hypothetical protein ACYS1A_18030 [Planctomycetota bacterium]|jgi:hypothetical protein
MGKKKNKSIIPRLEKMINDDGRPRGSLVWLVGEKVLQRMTEEFEYIEFATPVLASFKGAILGVPVKLDFRDPGYISLIEAGEFPDLE